MLFKSKNIHFFAKLAIFTAIATIILKSLAYLLTGSVGLLSDAVESLVNLATGIITLFSIKFALEPEDEKHQFGHSKIEYFSSLTEGLFILIAGGIIIVTASERLLNPNQLHDIGWGLIVSVIASTLNAFTAFYMLNASKKFNSIALKADAHHLMTDVYTTGGIILGVIASVYFNLPIIDPIIAIILGLHITKTSFELIYKSFHGLIDQSIEESEIIDIKKIIENKNLPFNLKSRLSGRIKFLYITLAVPDILSTKDAHDITVELEKEFFALDENIKPFFHIEPESEFNI